MYKCLHSGLNEVVFSFTPFPTCSQKSSGRWTSNFPSRTVRCLSFCSICSKFACLFPGCGRRRETPGSETGSVGLTWLLAGSIASWPWFPLTLRHTCVVWVCVMPRWMSAHSGAYVTGAPGTWVFCAGSMPALCLEGNKKWSYRAAFYINVLARQFRRKDRASLCKVCRNGRNPWRSVFPLFWTPQPLSSLENGESAWQRTYFILISTYFSDMYFFYPILSIILVSELILNS